MASRTDRAEAFARWQEADGLANAAEGVISRALTAFHKGEGSHPQPREMDASRELRTIARARLTEATARFKAEDPRTPS
jgi:hypothetical protein